MINLSLIILSNNEGVSIEDGVEIILSNEANLVNNIKNAQGKYITFTKDSDMIDPSYLDVVKKKVLDDFGVLFVDDEIQMGFYRTGKLWAIEHYDVKPDVITFGKSLKFETVFLNSSASTGVLLFTTDSFFSATAT